MNRTRYSLTLVELIIAMVLVSVIVLGLSSINIFSRYHVISSDRRTKLQNEVSFILEHMNKYVSLAIGNEMINGADSVVGITQTANSAQMKVYIDANLNGVRDDYWIAYRLDLSGTDSYRLRYCGRCLDSNCTFGQCVVPQEVLGTRITAFNPAKPVNASGQLNRNSLSANLAACWNPAVSESADNPCVTMNASISMPSVSVN